MTKNTRSNIILMVLLLLFATVAEETRSHEIELSIECREALVEYEEVSISIQNWREGEMKMPDDLLESFELIGMFSDGYNKAFQVMFHCLLPLIEDNQAS